MIWNWIGIIAGVWCLVLPACAQSNQWRDVESLGTGTPISVVKRVREECRVVSVTDSELTCDRDIGQRTRRLIFVRDQIEEVRLEMPGHNKMILGAIVGSAVGGLIGLVRGHQSSDPETRVYTPAVGVIAGAVIGGAVGSHIHGHGAVVFRK